MLRDTELAGLARTLGKDTDLTLTVSGETSYCSSDGRRINIARMPTTPLGRMLMTGLVFHEVAHKKYTRGECPAGLVGELTNIIEDVRVEALTLKERPGTRYDLEAVTRHYLAKDDLLPRDKATALLGWVLTYGYGEILLYPGVTPLKDRCRTLLEQELGQAFMVDLESLLQPGFAALTSTQEARSLAERILERLKQVAQEKPQETAAGELPPSSAAKEVSQTEFAGASAAAQPSPIFKTLDGSPSPGGQQAADCQCSDGEAHLQRSTLGPEELEQMLVGGSGRPGGYGDRSAALLQDLNDLSARTPQKLCAVIPLLPAAERVSGPEPFVKPVDEAQALRVCSRLRSRLLTLLQAQQRRAQSAAKSGRRMDTRRLVRLSLGDPRIFRKKEEVSALNTAVFVLIDGSGSMLTRTPQGESLSAVANASAFALHRTLYHLAGVSAASAVFAGREDDRLRLLADFGERPEAPWFAFRASGSTPTATGLWLARAALLGQPQPRKLLLLITDGYPDDVESAGTATRRLQRDGIEIGAIGLQTDAVKRLWPKHCVIDRVDDLPAALFGLLEGFLLNPALGRTG
ncbi:hypothetical protein [Trichloromonas sp.]|uniref:hypothetical protein n=1 Tax=Trichloromonas sp. TaxID=3069249 RepID=UPI001D589F7B|nr:hypothetical protein [Desulfuromonadaceae bacterium]MDY0269078.1 hypothetical protein [Trichloromonas sp.]